MCKIFVVMAVSLSMAVCFVAGVAEEAPRLPEGNPTPAPEGEGWINLFDEENAPFWKNVTDKKEGIFAIEDGVFHVIGQKPTRYIAWMQESFGDFELHVEFKLSEDANSGVFFRTDPENPVQGGMEVQVFGDPGRPVSTQSGGALYDVASPMFNMARPAGEWNSYDIRFVASRLEVVYNGWKVLDLDISLMTMPIGKFDTPLALLPREGHIILQNHGDEVWFRNLLVRRL